MGVQHIPNLITLLRIILLFPIGWALIHAYYQWAFYLFIVAGISDSFDGLLARRYGWISELGTIIDPVADKCVLVIILGLLMQLGQLPLALFTLVLVRDLWIIAGGIAYRLLIGRVKFAPPLTGKINTFFQLLLITLLLFQLAFVALPVGLIHSLFYIIAGTSVLSGIHYTVVWSLKAIQGWGRNNES